MAYQNIRSLCSFFLCLRGYYVVAIECFVLLSNLTHDFFTKGKVIEYSYDIGEKTKIEIL